PAGGGEPRVLTRPDTAQGESGHFFSAVPPQTEPGVFNLHRRPSRGDPQNARARLENRQTQKPPSGRGASRRARPRAPDSVAPGPLIYAAAGTLRAVRFDPSRLEVQSDAVAVVEHLSMAPTGAANYAIARNGTLIFITGGPSGVVSVPRSLVFVDRQGREEALSVPPRSYSLARLSPDGTRIALEISDQENDFWPSDLRRRPLALTRLTFDPGQDIRPVWTPDGQHIVFASSRVGAPNLFWHASDGSGGDERLSTSPYLQIPTAVTTDGTKVLL